MNIDWNLPTQQTAATAGGTAPMRTSAVQADIVKPANMQTLPSDPYNMLAQFGGLGYQPAAFDPTGSNNGYYGNATFIRSPLMQRYLQPTAMNTGAWLPGALSNAMPGWNAVSTPGQNPYYTASQTPAPLFPSFQQGGGAVAPTDLPGVNGNPYTSMWNQSIGQSQAPQPGGMPPAQPSAQQPPTQQPASQYSPNMQAAMQNPYANPFIAQSAQGSPQQTYQQFVQGSILGGYSPAASIDPTGMNAQRQALLRQYGEQFGDPTVKSGNMAPATSAALSSLGNDALGNAIRAIANGYK